MPELPEVEIQARTLEAWIGSKTFEKVTVTNRSLRWPITLDLEDRLTGSSCTRFFRRGKVMIITLDNGYHWLTHLGMTGKFVDPERDVNATPETRKHDHVHFVFDDKSTLAYRDPRRFGAMWVTDNWQTHSTVANLGAEPLDNQMTAVNLAATFSNRTKSIKAALMDARLIAGIGNIYACEALFKARISPFIPANSISMERLETLLQAIRSVLLDAIAAGGSTIDNYANVEGSGYFQLQLQVYGRDQQPCLECGHEITNTKITNRSTFWCERCQAD